VDFNVVYDTIELFINGYHCALDCWYNLCVFMELPEPGTFPIVKIIFLLWYVYALCVPEVLRAPGLEAG